MSKFFSSPADIFEVDKKILKNLLNLINELKIKSPNLIRNDLTQSFTSLEENNKDIKIKQELKIILPLIKEMVNPLNTNASGLIAFIELIEKRATAYHLARSNIATQQYNRFHLTLQDCITGRKSLNNFDSYFSPRHYYAVTLPESSKTDPDKVAGCDDYIEKSHKGKIAAKICIGIGISFLVIGAATIAFCLPLAIAAFVIGGLMLLSAGLYLGLPKMPNIEKIMDDEENIFEAGKKLRDAEIEKTNSETDDMPPSPAYYSTI